MHLATMKMAKTIFLILRSVPKVVWQSYPGVLESGGGTHPSSLSSLRAGFDADVKRSARLSANIASRSIIISSK